MKRFLRLTASLLCLSLCISLCAIPASASAFSDVSDNAWYASYVDYALSNGFMNGVGDNKFEPDSTTTRAMVVTILWRLSGEPNADAANLDDCPQGTWYSDAVNWAVQNGVVNGVGDNRFAPNAAITREQMATMLYRYTAYCRYDRSASDNLYAFRDRWAVSDWAVDAVRWAVGANLINGTTSSTLSPQGSATRAQIAAIMTRFDHNIKPVELDKAYTTLEVSGKQYYLGMSVSDLIAQAGQPDEQLQSSYEDAVYYVYGTENYENFFLALVYNNTVCRFIAAGKNTSYRGHFCGQPIDASVKADFDAAVEQSKYQFAIEYDTDSLDDNKVTDYVLTDRRDYPNSLDSFPASVLYAEAKVNFHLVNAYRAQHGLVPFSWSESAAAAARLHSEDMASQNYFDHDSLDGRNYIDRMDAQGISSYPCGENIAAGVFAGLYAFEVWMNSPMHRSNMLNAYYTHLGVGAGYNADSNYYVYWTQDFYA